MNMANAALHREKLVQATIRLYRERGYANTGLNDILKLSGAPKGSLYYYFSGGKEELTVEAIRVAGKIVENTLLDLAATTSGPQQFVASYCTLLAEWMQGSGFKSGCPIATTVLETVPFSAAITEISQAVFNGWITIVSDVYSRTNLNKSQAQEKAQHVIMAIEGALLLARVQQSPKPILLVPSMLNN